MKSKARTFMFDCFYTLTRRKADRHPPGSHFTDQSSSTAAIGDFDVLRTLIRREPSAWDGNSSIAIPLVAAVTLIGHPGSLRPRPWVFPSMIKASFGANAPVQVKLPELSPLYVGAWQFTISGGGGGGCFWPLRAASSLARRSASWRAASSLARRSASWRAASSLARRSASWRAA